MKDLLEAAQRANADPVLWNDLAAAQYEKAVRDDDVEGMSRALAYVSHAFDFNRPPVEAFFNRGLILNAVGLRAAAKRAYGEYLKIDGSSPSAAMLLRERTTAPDVPLAERWKRDLPRLEALCASGVASEESTALVRNYPQQARSWAEGDYLARWSDARAAGDPKAEQWLAVVRCIGTSLRQTSGDAMAADAVATIGRSSSPEAMRHLIDGHRLYRDGRVLYSQRKIVEAAPLLQAAEKELAAGGSPMALFARHYFANALYDQNLAPQALDIATRLAATAPQKYVALRAHALWTRASCLSRLKQMYASLDAAEAAAALFERLGERENATETKITTASSTAYLGRDHDAWQIRRDIFRGASETGNARILERAVNEAARAEVRRRHWNVAYALFTVQLAGPGVTPRVRFDGVLESSFAAALAEERPLNAAERGAIHDAANAVVDPVQREEVLDDWRYLEAVATRISDPARAVQLLSETAEYRTTRHRPIRLARILGERARAFRALGNQTAAIADLEQATTLVENERRTVESDDLRDSFFGSSDDAFRDLAEILYDSGRTAEAFTVTERARARVLIEKLADGSSASTEPLRSEEILRQLPPRTALVAITELKDRTIITTLSDGAIRSEAIPLGRAQLTRIVDDVVERKGSGSAPLGVLTRACSAAGAAGETLVIVPDVITSSVPFAALETSSGRYLIDDYAIVTAPSATAYLRARALKTASPRPEAALLVGDPAFDSRRYVLAPLPDAAEEVRRAARFYSNAIVQTGTAATRAAFLRDAFKADVIHLATHAISSPRDPAWVVALLSSSGGDDDLLYGEDVRRLALRTHAPVVVLAGCRTASAGGAPGAIRGLALAFLAAGGRSVAATLWNIDDAASKQLLLAFHQQLSRGVPPAEAMRQAQLKCAHSESAKLRDPSAWAGFQLIGSDE